MKPGRPTKYKPEYCEAIINYFDIKPTVVTKTMTGPSEEANTLPTILKFSKLIGVNHETLIEWGKVNPEFSAAYNRAREMQKEFIIENALRNNYQGYFAGLMMKNMFGWRDKNEIEHNIGESLLDKYKDTSVEVLKEKVNAIIGIPRK